MGNRNEESDREQSAYGRSEHSRDRQPEHGQGRGQGWQQSQDGPQRTRGQQDEDWQPGGIRGRGGQSGLRSGQGHGYGGEYASPGYGQGRQGPGRQDFGQGYDSQASSQGLASPSQRPGSGLERGYGEQQGFGGQGFGGQSPAGRSQIETGGRGQGWEIERGADDYGSQRHGQDQGGRFGQQGQIQPHYGQQDYAQQGAESYRPESFGYVGHLGARSQGGIQVQERQGQQFGYRYGENDRDRFAGDGGSQRFGSQGTQGNWSATSYRGLGPKNYARSDERIAEDVNERLTDDDDVDATRIEVKVEQGVVKLEGAVDKRWMKHRAEDIAESCSGVKEVENRIRVESGPGRSESSERSGQGRGPSGQSGLGSSSSSQTPH